jgi:hypothetical protein
LCQSPHVHPVRLQANEQLAHETIGLLLPPLTQELTPGQGTPLQTAQTISRLVKTQIVVPCRTRRLLGSGDDEPAVGLQGLPQHRRLQALTPEEDRPPRQQVPDLLRPRPRAIVPTDQRQRPQANPKVPQLQTQG